MCVIVTQPKGTYLEKELAQKLWSINKDGGGFAYITEHSTVEVEKYMKFNEFWTRFEQVRSRNRGTDFLVHMRIATHGRVDITNVHPFRVDEHTVMAHNGIIKGVPDHNEMSDTRVFIEEVLPELPETWLDSPYLVQMVEDWIGWSKLTFLTTNPKLKKGLYILNEQSGTTHDGMWFSNSNGLPLKKLSTPARPMRLVDGRWTEVSEDWNKDRLAQTDDYWGRAVDLNRINVGPIFYRSKVEEARKELGVLAPFTYQYSNNTWWCMGCLEKIVTEPGSQYGDCFCDETICLDCDEFTGVCSCERGFSGNILPYDVYATERKEKPEAVATLVTTSSSLGDWDGLEAEGHQMIDSWFE